MNQAADERSTVKRGQELTTALASAVRTAGYYDPGNAVMQQTGNQLLQSLRASQSEKRSVSFAVHSHSMFVDKVRVPASVSTYGRFADLMQLFEDWSITTLTFAVDISEEELMQALMLLYRESPSETEDLVDMLRERGIGGVHAETVEPGSGNEAQSLSPLLVYSAAMHLGVQLADSLS